MNSIIKSLIYSINVLPYVLDKAVPSSIGVLVAGTAILTDLKDSTEIADNLVAANVQPSSTNKESKIGKERRSKESSASSKNSGLLITKPVTLNHNVITLNSNTTTTTSTETKSAIIKIKPSQALSSKSSQNHLPPTGHNLKAHSQQKTSGLAPSSTPSPVKRNHTVKRSDQFKQNGGHSIGKNKSYATGIRKERKKKLSITSNKAISNLTSNLVNKLQPVTKTNGIAQQSTKLNQQVVEKNPKTNSSASKPQITNSNHQNSQRSSNSKHFLPSSAPEPTNSLVGSSSKSVLGLLNRAASKAQQPTQQKEAFTIVLDVQETSSPKTTSVKPSVAKTSLATKSSDQSETSKKLKIDLPPASSTPTPSAHKSCGSMRSASVTITPIAFNNSSTSAKEHSSPSLTAVQLDTASMRSKPSGSCLKAASTNNMLANQTGKSLEIHPCNFYSSSSNSAVVSSSKKAAADPPCIAAANSPVSNPSACKVNEANGEASSPANEFSMKGSTKKAAKAVGQPKQNSEKIEQVLPISHGWKFEGEPIKKMVMISVCD